MNESISVIGLGHSFIHQQKAIKRSFKKMELCDINKEKIKKYNAIKNYKIEIYGNYDNENNVIILDELKHYIKYL